MAAHPEKPPRLARWLIQTLVRDELQEEVHGDLEQGFYDSIRKSGRWRARLFYWYQVAHYLRPFALKRSRSRYNPSIMLQNYFKIGFRNLVKHKGYSSINIGGLAVGMAVAILIGLWVHDELTFNRYYANYDRLAQVMKGGTFEGQFYEGQMHLPYPVLDELKANYGENFNHVVAASNVWEFTLGLDDRKVIQKGMFIGDGGPSMLSLEMLRGSRSGLKDPHSIMLSESAAKTLFGDEDPMNKVIQLDKNSVKVTGVFRDFPDNTQFSRAQIFLPWDLHLLNNDWIKNQGWDNHFVYIYAEIKEGLTMEGVENNIREAEQRAIANLAYMESERKYKPEVLLLPMHDWHLRSNFKEGKLDGGPAQMVWLIGMIGGFVLMLACINFMNLSTARSDKRAKEVGVRKTVGSMRRQLVNQFFSESFIVVTIAFVLAMIIAGLSLPAFNIIATKQVELPLDNPWFWVACLSFVFVTASVAGSYPALYLSSFNAVRALKGGMRNSQMTATPRKLLVVLQFTVSVILITSTIVVYNQLTMAKDRAVGYQREGLLWTGLKNSYRDKVDVIRQELKNTGAVIEIGESGGAVSDIWSWNGGFSWVGKDPALEANMGTCSVGPQFGRTIGWEVAQGRDFSEEFASDSSALVINEAAARYMNLPNPVGETIHWTNRAYGVDKDFKIIGVMKDMVMRSPFEPTLPTVFFYQGNKGVLNIRLNPDKDINESLIMVEGVFKKLFPGEPFTYEFSDEVFALKFATEERVGSLAAIFAVLAILISCLGLFGLSSFVAEQRTKEIGIRKVVGATVISLWQLLSREFVVLVGLSCLIAVPVAYVFLKEWLQNYTIRTELSAWIFVAACGGALFVTLVTVSYQALKAATMNPVKSLRTE